jgi:hypothetical protein
MRSWCLLLLAGCFDDKAIDLQLQAPAPAIASQFSPACVASVEVWINGSTYPTNEEDSARGCVSLTGKTTATWNDVLASIRGSFEADMPDSGLGGVEIYGFAGPCEAGAFNDYDLIFYSHTTYEGGDSLGIPITPNLSCDATDVKIRPIDLLQLIKTGQCTQAAWMRGKMAVTTLSPYPWTDTLDWWGGQNGANIAADGVATFRGLTKTGPETCLALSNYTGTWESISCVGPYEQRVCATGTEYESPMVDPMVAAASQELPKVTKWGSLVIGAAWGAGPLAGATVTIDPPTAGEVVYFDMPPGVETGVGGLTPRGGTVTGVSGLFGIYTDDMVKITVTQNGRSVSRMVGGFDSEFSQVALIKL